jgi:ketosteroid isomerase-like protein
MVDHDAVRRWVTRYEEVWRTPGVDGVGSLFTDRATYLTSPWAPPVTGLAGISALWDAERDGPDEPFTMTSEVVAVDGDAAVVRVEVHYTGDEPQAWRDLWVLRFAADGRCSHFEEWPIAPPRGSAG